MVGIVAGRNRNLPVSRREFDSVIDQVPKNLLQSRRVRAHVHSLRAEVERTSQMFPIDFWLTDFERVLQQGMRINYFKVELHFAAIDPRQIQQVVDESRF